jgi:hypothetical protein
MDKRISDALHDLWRSKDLMVASRARVFVNYFRSTKEKVGNKADDLINFFKRSNLDNIDELIVLINLEVKKEKIEVNLKTRKFIVGFKEHLKNLIIFLDLIHKSKLIVIEGNYIDKSISACLFLQKEIKGSFVIVDFKREGSRINHLIIYLIENIKSIILQLQDGQFKNTRKKLVREINILVDVYTKFLKSYKKDVFISEERLVTGEILKRVA